jgi:hypothetical protein
MVALDGLDTSLGSSTNRVKGRTIYASISAAPSSLCTIDHWIAYNSWHDWNSRLSQCRNHLLRPIPAPIGTRWCPLLERPGHRHWYHDIPLIAHLLEVLVWTIVFAFCGEFTQLATAFYHSAMNYRTLGYGDVIMSSSWKIFGPLEAADGMLMFGVSTAMIFAVIQGLIQIRFPDVRT